MAFKLSLNYELSIFKMFDKGLAHQLVFAVERYITVLIIDQITDNFHLSLHSGACQLSFPFKRGTGPPTLMLQTLNKEQILSPLGKSTLQYLCCV